MLNWIHNYYYMETSIAIITTPGYILDPNYSHYLYNNGLLYDADYSIVNYDFIQNYEIILLEKNILLQEHIKKYTSAAIIKEIDTHYIIHTNNKLKKITIINTKNNESKSFFLSNEMLNKHSIFGDYIGFEHEYMLMVDDRKYYDLISYWNSKKYGTSVIKSLDYIGIDKSLCDSYIKQFNIDFYKKEYRLMDKNNVPLHECLKYGETNFLEYSTSKQRILYCLICSNQIEYDCVMGIFNNKELSNFYRMANENNFPTIYYFLSYAKNILTIEYDNKLKQEIKFEYNISGILNESIGSSDILFIELDNSSETFTIVLIYTDGQFKIFKEYKNSCFDIVTVKHEKNMRYCFSIDNDIILLKDNMWKEYYLYREKFKFYETIGDEFKRIYNRAITEYFEEYKNCLKISF